MSQATALDCTVGSMTTALDSERIPRGPHLRVEHDGIICRVVVAGIDVTKATLELSVSEGPDAHRTARQHSQVAQASGAVGRCESTDAGMNVLAGKLRETALNVGALTGCAPHANADTRRRPTLDAQETVSLGVVLPEAMQARGGRPRRVAPVAGRRRQLVSSAYGSAARA